MKKAEASSHSLYLVEPMDTIYDCLVKFEQNNLHTLLVESKGKVIGTVTDGDIRKALIRHRTLNTRVDTVMKMDYFFCESEGECKDLFAQNEYIFIIPMLDQHRELISIYLRF